MVQPKIDVNVVSNIVLTAGESYGVGAIVSTSSWGEDGKVRSFTNYKDVVEMFKSGALVDGAKYFFQNGGKELYILRCNPNAVQSEKTFQGSGSDVLKIKAKYGGSYGNNIAVTITANANDPNKRDIEITDGVVTETYTALSTNDEIVNAINSNSQLVVAEELSSVLVDATSKTYLTGGSDGATNNNDMIDYIQNYLWLKEFDYLMTPGFTDDALHASIQALLDSRATSENLYSIYIAGVDKFEDISTTLSRTATNSNGRLVVIHSSLYKGDGDLEDTNNWLDASYTACAYGGLLCSLPVQTSPTYKPVGFIAGKSLTERYYTSIEREQLISAGFTIFDRLTPTRYGCVMGVTRTGDNTTWNYMLDSRRKVDYLLTNFVEVGKSYIGQPNDELTRKNIRSGMLSVLAEARDNRMVSDYQVEVLQGSDPREVDMNATIKLVNEVDYIDINLTLSL